MRPVVNHRVDAGKLLQRSQPDADKEREFDGGLAQRLEAGNPRGRGLANDLLLGERLVRSVNAREIAASVLVAPGLKQIARTFRHEEHARNQDRRGHDGQPQHPAPRFVARERVVHDKRAEDADRDRELVKRNQRAANLRGRDFRDVERRDDRGDADPDADHEAGDEQRHDLGRKRRPDRARAEDDARHEQRRSASDPVGQVAGGDRTQNAAGKHDADREFRERPSESEVFGDEENGAGDDAGVVPEQQAAQRGNRRHEQHERSHV